MSVVAESPLTTTNTVLAIIVAAIFIATAIIGLFRSGRATAEKIATEKNAEYRRGEADGKAARDDEVALLRSQRDDARRERDAHKTRADNFENRYNDLRDRRYQ